MYQRTLLDNGVPVLSATMPNTYSVSIAIFIGAGSRYESDEIAGVSHFLEHMLFKGTQRWPTSRELSAAIEGVGGVVNGSTDREITVFWCKVAKLHFRHAISVLSDMVLNPLLDPAEVEKERLVVLEELSMTNDYPTYRVDQLIDEVLWPNQPMGRDVGGTKDSVRAITRDHILDYMKRQYTSRNAVVAVAGDVSHGEVTEALRYALKDWGPGEPLPWCPVQDSQDGPRIQLEQRKTDQAHICIGFPGLSLNHPDRHALSLMNVILGEGMSSRLFLELREKQGLAYDVHSVSNQFRDCGSVVVYCGVEPSRGDKAVGAILEQLDKLHEGVPEGELEKAKELSKGRLLLRMEDSRSVAMWLAGQELLLGKVSAVDQALQRIDAVTAEDIKRVARELIQHEKIKLAVVGPYRSDRRFLKLLEP